MTNQIDCPQCYHTLHCWRCSFPKCPCFVDTKEFHELQLTKEADGQ